MTLPRSEYPRPQFTRNEWLCLNGEWEFEIDHGDSGLEQGLKDRPLKDRITVPFCPESTLSGIGYVDFMAAVWYRRTVEIPSSWHDKKVLLHFQAVDYDTTVWVNGNEVVRHRGGFTPFSCDLAGIAGPGETIEIVVRARDYRDGPMPRGKQARDFKNSGCLYTRTTGIWQTVWMEPVPNPCFGRPRITPDVSNEMFHIQVPLSRRCQGWTLRAGLSDEDGVYAWADTITGSDFTPHLDLPIPTDHLHLWEPGDPYLYHLSLELIDPKGRPIDLLSAYAGLRSVVIEDKKVLINGKPLFQRLVLDQGFYPDGILTAPSDAALIQDIELSMSAGFNGARLHQKVFEERFLYHADRLGYLVWGEFPDWGSGGFGPVDDNHRMPATYITQWLEAITRDYSHPSIVGWCALNETSQTLTDRLTNLDDATRAMFLAAKALDSSRPVLDASGYSHRVPEADIYDGHDYEQNIEIFRQTHAGAATGVPFQNRSWHDGRNLISIPYRHQPYFVSEFGGIWWNPDVKPGENSWGYGNSPKDIDEWYARFEGLCTILLENPGMFAYCYTQLTDVFQEQNGIFTFDRRPKFDLPRLRSIQQKPASIEN